MMSFSPQSLLDSLHELPRPRAYCVALSGGLDSTVLLHALVVLRDELALPLSALHVDHGLQAASIQWDEHCVALCQRLSVPLRRARVEVGCYKDKGLEASARRARYQAFEAQLGEGEMLLSAHHQDDQAETLLLQLFRGGGVHGLAGMPRLRSLGSGCLARPLLDVTRAELLTYAEAHGLAWIEDPSNQDIRLERNFWRHELLPQLAQRRAGVTKVLARSAAHFAENAELLDELAALDLLACAEGDGLAIPAITSLSLPRQRNLLRYFIRQRGLPLPDHRRLQAILGDLIPAAADALPEVVWPGAELRRYRDTLYAMSPLPTRPAADWQQPWDGQGELVLPAGLGRYHLQSMPGGLRPACLQGELTVRLRRGGERLRLPGRTQHVDLKNLFQQAGIPPWQRERLPLLYLDGKLAQVAGLWTDAAFAVAQGEMGYMLTWLDE